MVPGQEFAPSWRLGEEVDCPRFHCCSSLTLTVPDVHVADLDGTLAAYMHWCSVLVCSTDRLSFAAWNKAAAELVRDPSHPLMFEYSASRVVQACPIEVEEE
jgi:hypothetical protein